MKGQSVLSQVNEFGSKSNSVSYWRIVNTCSCSDNLFYFCPYQGLNPGPSLSSFILRQGLTKSVSCPGWAGTSDLLPWLLRMLTLQACVTRSCFSYKS